MNLFLFLGPVHPGQMKDYIRQSQRLIQQHRFNCATRFRPTKHFEPVIKMFMDNPYSARLFFIA
jgi:hypothetical protein